MDRSTLDSADPILDEMGAMLDELLDSDQFSAVRLLLAHLGETVGSSVFRELECVRRCLRCGAIQRSTTAHPGSFDLRGEASFQDLW